jgi:two-component system, cell cycle sensor histidine kinase and response regulator CckA
LAITGFWSITRQSDVTHLRLSQLVRGLFQQMGREQQVTEDLQSGIKDLTVLLLEDNPVDTELAVRKLRAAGFDLTVDEAKNAAEFKAYAQHKKYDVILGDYRVPGWSGLEAVKWLRASGIMTPFILVTGTLGDELAIECVKSGADDYILKANLERLPVAVRRALAEQGLREARDRAERELRKSEEQYRMLFQANPHAMWVFDADTLQFLAVNDAALAHYGYTLTEFLSMTIADIRPAEELPHFLENIRKLQERGFQQVQAQPWKHRKKDGTIIDVEISAQPIKFGAHDARLVMVNDITERKKLEDQFLQAQKMEAIGRLAGGVAHDFNNLLMIIGSYAHLTRDQLTDAEKAGRYLSQIVSAVDKATLLTRQLLAFSRKHIQDLRTVDLNELVKDFCKMLPGLLGEDVLLKFNPSSQDCVVYCDKGLVEQAIMNLIVNSRDAMPHGGRITIETARLHLEDSQFKSEKLQVKPGEYVMLAVTDTGAGMDEQTKAKLFQPFFTTKEPGKGTGLGLSTVYAIVRQSHGYIWPYSELGHGTTFKLYFPYAGARPEPPAPTLEIEQQSAGTETILMVEDEQALRMAAAEFLGTKGYRVLAARDTAHALHISASKEERIDLLLTDLVMPGLGGADLARIIVKTHPDIGIIYMSGFTESPQKEDLAPGSVLLQKPFSLFTLATTIRQVLEKNVAAKTEDVSR